MARSVRLTWDSVPGAVSYYVKRGAAAGGPYATIAAGVAATNYQDSGLTGGATYYYVVSAATAAEGPDSNPAPATLPSGISGRIALDGVSDLTAVSPYAPLGVFAFQFRAPGTTTAVYTLTAQLTPVGGGSPYGTFFLTGIPDGTYDVAIKGTKNLRVSLQNFAVTGNANLPDVLLLGGDANNDNSVDSTDFGLLIGLFNTEGSIAGSGYSPEADFNDDGFVDSTDFGILIGNYGQTGAM